VTETILNRSVIRVTGEDCQRLLNDTLTGNFSGAMGLEGRWFALLSPQGKVLAEGIATQADGAYFLIVHPSIVESFLKRMRMYRLRAKVEFEDVSETHAVYWNEDRAAVPPSPWGIALADNRLRQRLWLIPRESSVSISNDQAAWQRLHIAAGVPAISEDFETDQVFAHDIGLDILDGIDFAKGCYVGQEVVSRMKHRGTARRRPVIVSGIEAPAGTPVMAGDREAGVIGQVVNGMAVAIVRLDRITDPAAVSVGGKPVQIALPVWATYKLGEAIAEDE
jgi:folate-binding protein YgfZ